MSLAIGHQKIIARLIDELPSGSNIVLPNGPRKDLPRYVVMEAAGRQRPVTLDGVSDAYPEVVVRVETQAGAYSTESSAMVQAIVDAFPLGLHFSGMVVHEAPASRPPLPVRDAVYSVPVVVTATISFGGYLA